MSASDRQGLVEKVAACLKENNLGDVPVSTSVENVGILMAGQMEKSTSLKVEKNLKSNQGEQADKFNASVKSVIDGVANCNMKV